MKQSNTLVKSSRLIWATWLNNIRGAPARKRILAMVIFSLQRFLLIVSCSRLQGCIEESKSQWWSKATCWARVGEHVNTFVIDKVKVICEGNTFLSMTPADSTMNSWYAWIYKPMTLYSLSPQFPLDRQANVPTWFFALGCNFQFRFTLIHYAEPVQVIVISSVAPTNSI